MGTTIWGLGSWPKSLLSASWLKVQCDTGLILLLLQLRVPPLPHLLHHHGRLCGPSNCETQQTSASLSFFTGRRLKSHFEGVFSKTTKDTKWIRTHNITHIQKPHRLFWRFTFNYVSMWRFILLYTVVVVDQKRVSTLLDLEFQEVVSQPMWVLRIKLRSSLRTADILSCWAISPVPPRLFWCCFMKKNWRHIVQ